MIDMIYKIQQTEDEIKKSGILIINRSQYIFFFATFLNWNVLFSEGMLEKGIMEKQVPLLYFAILNHSAI